MDHAQYLLLMGGCLLVTLPLEFVVGARVYRSPRRLLLALIPTVVLFAAWDIVGIERDHWFYNPRYISGIHLGPMPLEELVFFITIPLCGLLTLEAVRRILTVARQPGRIRVRWPEGLVREHASGVRSDG